MLVPLSDSIEGGPCLAGFCCLAVSSFRNATAVGILSWVHQRCASSIHTVQKRSLKKKTSAAYFYPPLFFNLEFVPFKLNKPKVLPTLIYCLEQSLRVKISRKQPLTVFSENISSHVLPSHVMKSSTTCTSKSSPWRTVETTRMLLAHLFSAIYIDVTQLGKNEC